MAPKACLVCNYFLFPETVTMAGVPKTLGYLQQFLQSSLSGGILAIRAGTRTSSTRGLCWGAHLYLYLLLL